MDWNTSFGNLYWYCFIAVGLILPFILYMKATRVFKFNPVLWLIYSVSTAKILWVVGLLLLTFLVFVATLIFPANLQGNDIFGAFINFNVGFSLVVFFDSKIRLKFVRLEDFEKELNYYKLILAASTFTRDEP